MVLSSTRLIGAAALAALLLSACAPVARYQGYTVLESNPGSAKVGEDTMTTVRTRYGSPTTVSTFEPNIWYYMSQTTDQIGAYRPRLRAREIVSITFDKTDQKVAAVKKYTAQDGRVIAYSDRETPTSGRELGIIQQMLGTLGAGAILPRQDDDPGNLGGR